MINDLPLKSDKVSIISSIINADFNFDNPSSPCQIRHPNDLQHKDFIAEHNISTTMDNITYLNEKNDDDEQANAGD